MCLIVALTIGVQFGSNLYVRWRCEQYKPLQNSHGYSLMTKLFLMYNGIEDACTKQVIRGVINKFTL